ncbi:phosphatidylinositol 3-kinase, putative [Plasmodium berghei]|uniref:phosphatidylinositol 3-kinase n=2 Tax=Plasmodium berghei TaxID=5821 RepID=A0A509AM04_PLABA|nr:phosphatidylinositol 3-kinase, putative [Plasmodium berghei ANKA]SCM23719.1 phosphatidylinositol 3-kinase, putative [Plasmodium berghei]SCN26740.1 phosphatidylinositol 3-kinase, putative [Plasmodium berghei]SCO61055.1 phosphatidylinositol 3-kinase, putative [Plasmodium berghei]SCO63159.1 phosphatidylinositol 3-kinase, putative [Plasmodium berghei]VUC56570.1 phosphatidylinositol 3-kinase, putative [Plasmodium berghei ANKA]|eukprot:XP_034422356.1 phosphatidylinositol 3-kinase, putative [Plasmodium berghei ANKA]
MDYKENSGQANIKDIDLYVTIKLRFCICLKENNDIIIGKKIYDEKKKLIKKIIYLKKFILKKKRNGESRVENTQIKNDDNIVEKKGDSISSYIIQTSQNQNIIDKKDESKHNNSIFNYTNINYKEWRKEKNQNNFFITCYLIIDNEFFSHPVTLECDEIKIRNESDRIKIKKKKEEFLDPIDMFIEKKKKKIANKIFIINKRICFPLKYRQLSTNSYLLFIFQNKNNTDVSYYSFCKLFTQNGVLKQGLQIRHMYYTGNSNKKNNNIIASKTAHRVNRHVTESLKRNIIYIKNGSKNKSKQCLLRFLKNNYAYNDLLNVFNLKKIYMKKEKYTFGKSNAKNKLIAHAKFSTDKFIIKKKKNKVNFIRSNHKFKSYTKKVLHIDSMIQQTKQKGNDEKIISLGNNLYDNNQEIPNNTKAINSFNMGLFRGETYWNYTITSKKNKKFYLNLLKYKRMEHFIYSLKRNIIKNYKTFEKKKLIYEKEIKNEKIDKNNHRIKEIGYIKYEVNRNKKCRAFTNLSEINTKKNENFSNNITDICWIKNKKLLKWKNGYSYIKKYSYLYDLHNGRISDVGNRNTFKLLKGVINIYKKFKIFKEKKIKGYLIFNCVSFNKAKICYNEKKKKLITFHENIFNDIGNKEIEPPNFYHNTDSNYDWFFNSFDYVGDTSNINNLSFNKFVKYVAKGQKKNRRGNLFLNNFIFDDKKGNKINKKDTNYPYNRFKIIENKKDCGKKKKILCKRNTVDVLRNVNTSHRHTEKKMNDIFDHISKYTNRISKNINISNINRYDDYPFNFFLKEKYENKNISVATPPIDEIKTLNYVLSIPLAKINDDGKKCLWKFRLFLVNRKETLGKFIKSVNWNDKDEEKEAISLLRKWSKPSLENCLELFHLYMHYNVIKKYIIDIIKNAKKEQLKLYLFQIIQRLRTFNYQRIDDLFIDILIHKCAKSKKLSIYLYWFLLSETQDKNNGKLYLHIHKLFINKLVKSNSKKKKKILEILKNQNRFRNQLLYLTIIAKNKSDHIQNKTKKIRKNIFYYRQCFGYINIKNFIKNNIFITDQKVYNFSHTSESQKDDDHISSYLIDPNFLNPSTAEKELHQHSSTNSPSTFISSNASLINQNEENQSLKKKNNLKIIPNDLCNSIYYLSPELTIHFNADEDKYAFRYERKCNMSDEYINSNAMSNVSHNRNRDHDFENENNGYVINYIDDSKIVKIEKNKDSSFFYNFLQPNDGFGFFLNYSDDDKNIEILDDSINIVQEQKIKKVTTPLILPIDPNTELLTFLPEHSYVLRSSLYPIVIACLVRKKIKLFHSDFHNLIINKQKYLKKNIKKKKKNYSLYHFYDSKFIKALYNSFDKAKDFQYYYKNIKCVNNVIFYRKQKIERISNPSQNNEPFIDGKKQHTQVRKDILKEMQIKISTDNGKYNNDDSIADLNENFGDIDYTFSPDFSHFENKKTDNDSPITPTSKPVLKKKSGINNLDKPYSKLYEKENDPSNDHLEKEFAQKEKQNNINKKRVKKYNEIYELTIKKYIYKAGDDLRQDHLVIQVIYIIDNIWKKYGLNLKLTLYRVLALSTNDGFIEFVDYAESISSIKKNYNGEIRQYFIHHSKERNTPLGFDTEILENFISSCAGYSVITYILGIGDRHLDNLMVSNDGRFFHIDFGYIFGEDPKPFSPPMKLCKEMIEAMGGAQSVGYEQFLKKCCLAYKYLRYHSTLLISLLDSMCESGLKDMKTAPELCVLKVQEKFRLDLNDEAAEIQFLEVINASVKTLFPVVVDKLHEWALNWK